MLVNSFYWLNFVVDSRSECKMAWFLLIAY
jgi:hypothetical protein